MVEIKLNRPRDAATLILYKKIGHNLEILMGCRDNKHAFMPNRYVFPGGAVDKADRFVKTANELRTDVWYNLSKSCSRSRARALAAAAVRETWEETGLRLAKKQSLDKPDKIQESWRGFHQNNYAPAFQSLDFVCRAITPPGRPRRFNARFFVAPATEIIGKISGNGELSDINWFTIKQAKQLPIPDITKYVLDNLPTWLEVKGKRQQTPLLKRVGKQFVEMTE
ncbi:MAG: hypothetical protein CMM30_02335 [Rhodospirillaceae bacterium]|nr:hypothetical protein [Rhodospirillaceae bacterium]|tara:strand:+ start:5980 stop:6651 length:672 start_codon:yes stop_codon:yes gene_type:complete